MRKEILIAIILGAGLGLAIAFGVWRANLAFTPRGTPQETTSASVIPTNTPSPEASLVITQPEDESLVDSPTITIEGKTIPGATVVITNPTDEEIVLADSNGVFRGQLSLDSGANALLVTAVLENDQTIEQQLTVTYSSEFEAEQ